jgi:hypothetical protein
MHQLARQARGEQLEPPHNAAEANIRHGSSHSRQECTGILRQVDQHGA